MICRNVIRHGSELIEKLLYFTHANIFMYACKPTHECVCWAGEILVEMGLHFSMYLQALHGTKTNFQLWLKKPSSRDVCDNDARNLQKFIHVKSLPRRLSLGGENLAHN